MNGGKARTVQSERFEVRYSMPDIFGGKYFDESHPKLVLGMFW